ncbi:phage late control D family protein [Tropicimonas sp. IMCC34043]|uniref:phage late control D family protein n=1 Tax=Tropicimonas sp. IMCC34043 TaxID=2248760 RepID=UPI000E26060E|nr:hypothetical protein [Tropicimonas sp. IMCC34043]
MAGVQDTPQIAVSVDGTSVAGAAWERLVRLEVTDREGIRSDAVSIAFDDSEPRFISPRRGAVLQVSIGFRGEDFRGDYVVDQVEFACLPHRISVSGHAADFRAEMKTTRSRHWDDTSVGRIVAQIAGEHGLIASVADILGELWWIGALALAALVIWGLFGRIQAARVDDARSGANLGR